METNLQEIENIQQTLQIQGLEDLTKRLQEAREEYRRSKDQFEVPIALSEDEKYDMLLILQKRLEEVNDECTELMTAFLEAREKQRMVTMKNKAIEICADVSRLLTLLMVTMLESEPAVEIFGIFRSALEFVEADLKDESMVIKKISSLMKIIDESMDKKKKKAFSKSIDLTKIEDECMEKVKKQKTEEEEMKVNEAQLEELFDKFLSAMMSLEFMMSSELMMSLELVMKDPGVPDAKKLTGSAMEVLKARVESCDKLVDDLKEEVYGLELVNEFVDESGYLIGFPLAQRMEEEIGGVWPKLEDEAVVVEEDEPVKVEEDEPVKVEEDEPAEVEEDEAVEVEDDGGRT